MPDRERLLVEVVRADEVCEGDEVVIVEFRDRVSAVRHHAGHAWVTLVSGEGAQLSDASQVLRLVAAEPSSTEGER